MAITNRDSGTNVNEIAERITHQHAHRQPRRPGAFSLNQYLSVDDEPMLFHTGPRKMFPLVHEAVAAKKWARRSCTIRNVKK